MKGFVIATRDLVENKKRVRFMYRETTDDSRDSGWRFFSGDESDEYANDPNNLAIYSVDTIAAIDPDIAPYIEAPCGSAFEREDPNGPFVISTGYTVS